MKKVIITQTILNIDDETRILGDSSVKDVGTTVRCIFNKAMQDAGFKAMEYYNTTLAELDMKE